MTSSTTARPRPGTPVRGPVVRTYRPRGTARALFACRDPEVLLSGPAGTGKSRACLEKVHALMLANPGARALIVRKTASTLASTALATYRQHVAIEAIAGGDVVFYGGSAQEPPQYRYVRNGSAIVVGGMDKATKIMSSEYDVIYVQEAIELTADDWESLTTRLRNGRISFQQLIADTNPSTPTHWLKQRCDSGSTTMMNSAHTENPTLFDDTGHTTDVGQAYLGKLDALTGVRRQRLRDGLWVAAEGIIYEEFDPAVHLVAPFVPPPSWARYWAIDFGFTNPFVLQRWAEDPDGRLFLYAEIFMSGRTVDVHARTVMGQVAPGWAEDPAAPWAEPRPTAIICDHDAEGRATFKQVTGLNTVAANKKVGTGIEAVKRRLVPAGDGRARLFIMRGAVAERDQSLVDARKPASTEEELPGYIWDIGAGHTVKEVPLKQNDHGMDALRYVTTNRDLGSRPRIRSISA